MASLDTIVSGIVAIVGAVSGVGNAVKYLQHTPDEKSFNAAYVTNGVLNTWIVTREQSKAVDRGAGPDNVRDRHSIAIYGYLAVTAATTSEEQHQNTTEAVRLALRANRRLPNAAGFLTTPSDATFQPVIFGGVLCWRSKITLIGETVRQGGPN
jgi:hypothetical protein